MSMANDMLSDTTLSASLMRVDQRVLVDLVMTVMPDVYKVDVSWGRQWVFSLTTGFSPYFHYDRES